MRLSKIPVKRSSFKHPLFYATFPETLKEEEKPALISKIRMGDIDAADTVILSHVKLALSIVGRYMAATKNSSISDDLVSAALEGLCHGVNKIKLEGLPHDNLTGYLTIAMHRFISEYLDHLPVVRVPRITRYDRKVRGEESFQPSTSQLTEEIIEKKFDFRVNNTSQLELNEILDKIAQSPTEREIIALRIEGYKDDAIADQIGLSKTSVFLIRRELEVRFVELFGG